MFSHILVPLDGSEAAEAAIAPAAAMARVQGASLLFVVVSGLARAGMMFDAVMDAEYRRYETERLEPLAARLQHELGVPARAMRLVGTDSVARTLAECVQAENVKLVVMTTHGRTRLRRAWNGSVADDLVRRITAPVLMLRRQGEGAEAPLGRFARMLVPLDGSRAAEAVLEPALAIARRCKATVILGRVVPPVPLEYVQAPGAGVTDAEAAQLALNDARRYLDAVATGLRSRVGMEIATVVELEPTGFPTPPTAATVALLALRERADLVALTSHRRGSSRLLVSSVADQVLRDTNCALLICPVAYGTASRRLARNRKAAAVIA